MTTSNTQLPRVLTEEEIEALLETARASGPQDFMLVALPLDTGLRLREIANLRASSFQRGGLLVDGKTGTRWVPVSNQVASALESLAQGGDVIWKNRHGGPMTADALGFVYQRLFERAGISGLRRGPHTLRHTCGVRFIRAGGGVRQLQEILGHENIETTMIYVTLAAVDVAEDHAIHSPVHSLALLDPAEASEVATGASDDPTPRGALTDGVPLSPDFRVGDDGEAHVYLNFHTQASVLVPETPVYLRLGLDDLDALMAAFQERREKLRRGI